MIWQGTLTGLANSMHSLLEFVFLYHCLIEYLDNFSSTTDDDPLCALSRRRPSWLPPPDEPTDIPIVPLEPMVKLTELDLHVGLNPSENMTSPCFLQSPQDRTVS